MLVPYANATVTCTWQTSRLHEGPSDVLDVELNGRACGWSGDEFDLVEELDARAKGKCVVASCFGFFSQNLASIQQDDSVTKTVDSP